MFRSAKGDARSFAHVRRVPARQRTKHYAVFVAAVDPHREGAVDFDAWTLHAMDRTSITRALAPLERDGLIDSRSGADKRIRIISVTSKGRKLIDNAEPEWHKAQEALMEIVGEDRWREMCALLRDTTRMVRQRTPTAAGNIYR
jgi:hypothetical protein